MEASRPRTWTEATEILRASLPNYEERPQQTRLAEAIEVALEDGTPLIGQAGTGTGKSLAGLVPMILSGRQSYYSTGTKALQAQIMDKDLPFLREHLGVDFRYAMLQGRSNYVCHAQLMQSLDDAETAEVREAVDSRRRGQAPPSSRSRPVTRCPSRSTTARGARSRSRRTTAWATDCPFYATTCRAQYSKAVASTAQVVVVNHALVATDAKIHADTGGEFGLLGAIDNMVVDEAHELEQYVVGALEARLTLGTFRALSAFLRSKARDLEMDRHRRRCWPRCSSRRDAVGDAAR